MSAAIAPEGYSRREQIGWYFYEWATAGFTTTVLTVIIGPYLTTVTKAAADPSGFVHPLGIAVRDGSFFPYVVSLSVLLQIVCMPILGAIADYSERKKQMLAVSAYLGATLTMGLYFLQGTNYLLGGILYILANLSYGASVVFANAFLPRIASPDQRDSVSSQSWALGALGGGLLLAMNLALITKAGAFGLDEEQAVRIALGSAGVWWAVFALVPLRALRNRQTIASLPAGRRYVMSGFSQLRHTVGKVTGYPQTVFFLVAYLIYNDGVQTVIGLWSEFGQEELGLDISVLTEVVLMVQFVAFVGALAFNYLAAVVGAKRALVVSLLMWAGTLLYTYSLLRTTAQVFVVAAVIAMALGGSQALSRSLYSLMIPRGQEAEYFSLYVVSSGGTSWLGPLLFGLALQLTGSYRIAIVSLVLFFVLGLVLLARVNVRRAAADAGNSVPSQLLVRGSKGDLEVASG
jgi:UMF1 family MFS transporter